MILKRSHGSREAEPSGAANPLEARPASSLLAAGLGKNARRTLVRIVKANIEQIILSISFAGAIAFGYYTSTRLWEIEFSGDAWLTDPPDKPTLTIPPSTTPFPCVYDVCTRDKYLQYFRPMTSSLADAALDRHGGPRVAEAEAARQLAQFAQKFLVHEHAPDDQTVPEDEIWEEVRYRASPVGKPPLAASERQRRDRVSAELDVLIQMELVHNATSPSDATGFRLLPDASLTARNRRYACSAMERPVDAPMSEKRRVLFILGAQKAGTTYLHQALTRHPSFIGAENQVGQPHGRWQKEPSFFDRWPLPQPAKWEFIKLFPTYTWDVPDPGSIDFPRNYTLLDSTPEYLHNAWAPPRIKAMWPQAKFVVLLRDPAARAHSAWATYKHLACQTYVKESPHGFCPFPSFAELILLETRLLREAGCTFGRQDRHLAKTWPDCHRCKVSMVKPEDCMGWWKLYDQPCHTPPFSTLSVSSYAAQIAWWFAHFPRDQFLFVRSKDLRTQASLVRVLNRILEFTELGTEKFTIALLRGLWGHSGTYSIGNIDPLDSKALGYLELFFRQHSADLKHLLGPSFPGMAREFNYTSFLSRSD